MRHASLFSGIGGFDLAAEWMGWQNVFHCEWNPFGQRVLKYYWPKAISYHDISKTDFTIHRGTIDIITGGFPCQPYSIAGKRKGKEDDRHLWPQMLRAIREIQPRWVVGENVFGLVNWSGGLVFHEVQADLEAEGYEVQPFVLPACAVNAPHRRDRVWFVAYRSSREQRKEVGGRHEKTPQHGNTGHGGSGVVADTDNSRTDIEMSSEQERQKSDGIGGFSQPQFRQIGREWDAADTKSQSGKCMQPELGESCEQKKGQFRGDGGKLVGEQDATDTNGIGLRGESNGVGNARFFSQNDKASNWKTFPTVSPVCNGNDGLYSRLDSITFPKWRHESIKAGGNAIVPQVALQIFKTIEEYERHK